MDGNALQLLTNLRVLEFGDGPSSATAAMHLALLGAQVTLAEPPSGSPLRRLATQGWAARFCYASRGKESHPLDSVLAEIASTGPVPDILFEPQQLDPALSSALNRLKQRPESGRIITVSFAESDGRVLTEMQAQAASGMLSYLGTSNGPALRVGYDAITYSAAVLAVQGIIAALLVRDRSGFGQSVRLPLSRAAASLLNNVATASVAPDQETYFSRSWAHRPYVGVPCTDGAVEFIFYGLSADENWRRFCKALGAESLLSNSRLFTHEQRMDRPDELQDALGVFTSRLKRTECVDLLRRAGAVVMPKNSLSEAALSEQASANAMIDRSRGETEGLPGGPWELDGVRPFVGAISGVRNTHSQG